MKVFLQYYFIYLLLLLNFSGFSQNVSYYILGENELKNADIYSVLQTNDQRLYVATDEGLYEYKHGSMQVIQSAIGQLDTSLFNLRENSKGEVFCYNLNGQIFKVEGNRLVIYNQIPKSLLSQNQDMEIDNNDNLIFISKNLLKIDDKEIKEIHFNDSNRNRLGGITKLPNENLVFTRQIQDTILAVVDGKVTSYIYQRFFDGNDQYPSGSVHFIGENLVTSSTLDKLTSVDNNRLIENHKSTYNQFNDSIIWRRNYTNGVETISNVNGELKITNSFFNNIFISEIAKGPTGLLFFGTFGKGLIVVPNLQAREHSLENYGKNIQSIAADELGNVFISDRVNGIFSFRTKVEPLTTYKNFVPQKVFLLKDFKSNIHVKYPKLLYNNSFTPEIRKPNLVDGALKNVFEIDSQTLLLSSSLGVYKYGNKVVINDSLWNSEDFETTSKLNGNSERCSDAVFDSIHNNLYISTISSLIQIGSDGRRKNLKFKDKPIIANDLLLYKNSLWVATQDFGILIFKNGLLEKQLSEERSIGNTYINKIEECDDKIFISHKTGFQIYNPIIDHLRSINRSEGIESATIEDFSLGSDKIWFAANAKLLSLPINDIPDYKIDFITKIDSIIVKDMKVDLTQQGKFDYDKNELSVYLDFKGLLFDQEAYYSYKLDGLDKKLKQIPVTESEINYDYLPPGSYTLLVTANYRGSRSNTLEYSFVIEKPYWQTWWFIILALIALIVLISYIIYSRNKKIKKTNKVQLEQQMLKTDLIESELKALRSQMNPHFIFNSLNSIQDLILQKDTDASYDYIVLFSNLVRNALNYSNEAFITIEKEVEFLETYLKLEKLRFGNEFIYSIENKVSKNIKVPSLIIQPFVENAIVHGLFHKQNQKVLNISIELSNDLLYCSIIDNGVGRNMAQEIQKRQGSEHKSFALSSIHKRLEILNSKYHPSIGFTITDLYQDDNPTGTKVVITLPYIV